MTVNQLSYTSHKVYHNLTHATRSARKTTPLQADIIKSFSDGKVVLVDSTHRTNSYDFTLITVVVIGELGEGFSVAWCISNGEDQFAPMNFFHTLKSKVRTVSLRWFM